MAIIRQYFRDLRQGITEGWNCFWFTPADAATLAVIRIAAGLMLLYTNLVWSLALPEFFGQEGWLSRVAVNEYFGFGYDWSVFWWVERRELLWAVHLAALLAFTSLALGFCTRAAALVAYLAAVSYANRAPAAMFGLDEIGAMLAMYLVVGRAGDAYSLDRWLARPRGAAAEIAPPAVSTNIAIRLIQVHMCVVYFFSGTSKLLGPTWWGGSALWFALANKEYQTVDMTWLMNHAALVNLMTHAVVWWEVTFAALVWPRPLRPLVLAMAIPLHLGIGLCLGMMTFGLIMLTALLAFIPPSLVRRILGSLHVRRKGTQTAL